jgi:hypothetical protein
MAISILPLNSDMYYCQTREGMLYVKQLPLLSMTSKGTAKKIDNEQISRLCGDCQYKLTGDRLYSIYRSEERVLFMDVH